MFFIFFLFNVIYFALAGVMIKAPCPDIEVIKNFDMAEFCRDKWYQTARYPDDFERDGDCVVLDLTNHDGVCEWQAQEIMDGKLNTISGNLTYDTPVKSGILDLNSPILKDVQVHHTFPLKVLQIDYDKFVLSYECRYNETTKTRRDYAWIFTKSPKIEGQAKKELDELLDSNKYIDRQKLQWLHLSDEYCKTKQ